MNRIGPASALCLVSSLSLAADKPVAGVLNVYVTTAPTEGQEKKDVDDATKQQLKAKRDEAREARKAREKALKEQYGKKRETWPASADDELFRLEEAEALANAAYEYRRIDPKGSKDAVKDILNSLRGKGMAGVKEHASVVASAGEADLVVNVLARRGLKTLPTQIKPDRCYVLFSIGPGGEMKPARFARVPAGYKLRQRGLSAWKLRAPKPPKEPGFLYEASNGYGTDFGCHGAAANSASAAINKFIEDNYATLKGR